MKRCKWCNDEHSCKDTEVCDLCAEIKGNLSDLEFDELIHKIVLNRCQPMLKVFKNFYKND